MQGAERQVRLPQDLLRFQHLPMSVTFQLEGSERQDPHHVITAQTESQRRLSHKVFQMPGVFPKRKAPKGNINHKACTSNLASVVVKVVM